MQQLLTCNGDIKYATILCRQFFFIIVMNKTNQLMNHTASHAAIKPPFTEQNRLNPRECKVALAKRGQRSHPTAYLIGRTRRHVPLAALMCDFKCWG